MIRSSASRLISSPGMLALDPRHVEGGGQGLAGGLFGEGGAGCGRGLRRLLEESFEQLDREREDRSEERRVGKECICRGQACQLTNKPTTYDERAHRERRV